MSKNDNKSNIRVWDSKNKRIDLSDTLKGRSIFIVCSGPSLAEMDLTLLNQRGVLSMGINNSPSLFRPNYWVAGDEPRKFIREIWDDPTIVKFAGRNYREDYVRRRDEKGNLIDYKPSNEFPNVYFYNRRSQFNPPEFFNNVDFTWGAEGGVTDAIGVRGTRSTLMVAIKMAWYLGCGKIYLLGCDFKMGDGYHYAFPQNRTDKAMRNNNRNYVNMSKRFTALLPYLKKEGLEIYNCTPKSNLKVFPYLDYLKAINTEKRICDPNSINTLGMYEKPS